MSYQATVIHPDGSIESLRITGTTERVLAILKDLIGGYIEVVPLPDKRYMAMRYDGKVHSLECNELATVLAREAESIPRDDYIAGTAVVISQSAIR